MKNTNSNKNGLVTKKLTIEDLKKVTGGNEAPSDDSAKAEDRDGNKAEAG